jgi:hypothetical protein
MTDLFKTPDLSALTDRQLLEGIYTMLSTAPNLKPAHKPSGGTPKRRHEYEPEFEELWKAYPARNGSNPKWKAQQCWRARIKEAAAIDVNGEGKTAIGKVRLYRMLQGVQRYAAWCEATAKTGTEMVMQATRFLGPEKEYENPWDVPLEVKEIKLPRDNNELLALAKEQGIQPKTGETWAKFRRRVKDFNIV